MVKRARQKVAKKEVQHENCRHDRQGHPPCLPRGLDNQNNHDHAHEDVHSFRKPDDLLEMIEVEEHIPGGGQAENDQARLQGTLPGLPALCQGPEEYEHEDEGEMDVLVLEVA